MGNLQIKRGVKANLPVLKAGEPAFTTDTNYLYVGNGTKNIQVANYSDILNMYLYGSTVVIDLTGLTVTTLNPADNVAILFNDGLITLI